MIIVFGAVLMNIRTLLDKNAPRPQVHFAQRYELSLTGKGAVQSVAAARSSEKTALISHIGDDHYGKNILLRLRQNGVTTSGVARHNKIPTGTRVQIGYQNPQLIYALGASEKTSHEQAPEEIIDESTIILVHDEFPAAYNLPLLAKAKEQGATVILNAGVRGDLSAYDFNNLDYIIIDQEHTSALTFIKQKAPHKLITLMPEGACEHEPMGDKALKIPAPALKNYQWADATCSEDAFCGTFAACLKAKKPLLRALREASYARALTAGKHGDYHTIPYKDDLRDTLKEVSD